MYLFKKGNHYFLFYNNCICFKSVYVHDLVICFSAGFSYSVLMWPRFAVHNYQRDEEKRIYLFLNYRRNEDKPKFLFLNYRRNKDEAKYLFLNYRRNEDEAKYLFPYYRRNVDEVKYLLLNYQRNEDEAKYWFLNYQGTKTKRSIRSSTIDDLPLLVFWSLIWISSQE